MTVSEDWIQRKYNYLNNKEIRNKDAIVINLDDGKNNKAMKKI